MVWLFKIIVDLFKGLSSAHKEMSYFHKAIVFFVFLIFISAATLAVFSMSNSFTFSHKLTQNEYRLDRLETNNKEFQVWTKELLLSQQETLQELKNISFSFAAIAKKGLAPADKTRIHIMDRGLDTWEVGQSAIIGWIETNHYKYKGRTTDYYNALEGFGMSILGDQMDITLKEVGIPGMKMSRTINEKVFSPFLTDMKSFVYKYGNTELSYSWKREIRDIFNTGKNSWRINFLILWGEGRV